MGKCTLFIAAFITLSTITTGFAADAPDLVPNVVSLHAENDSLALIAIEHSAKDADYIRLYRCPPPSSLEIKVITGCQYLRDDLGQFYHMSGFKGFVWEKKAAKLSALTLNHGSTILSFIFGGGVAGYFVKKAAITGAKGTIAFIAANIIGGAVASNVTPKPAAFIDALDASNYSRELSSIDEDNLSRAGIVRVTKAPIRELRKIWLHMVDTISWEESDIDNHYDSYVDLLELPGYF